MTQRFPDRERDPSWQVEKAMQPDPMLQDRHKAGPVAIGLAALFAVLIVAVLFYGLNNGREETIATQGTESSISTTGSAPAGEVNAPPHQSGQKNTGAQQAAQDKSGGQSGGRAQPANQGQEGGQGNQTGKPAEKR
jgi:hypothetical protein